MSAVLDRDAGDAPRSTVWKRIGAPLWAQCRARPALAAALVVLIALVLLALFAPALSRHDPLDISPLRRLQPPSSEFWFGTDALGRDLFSRTLIGGRVSILVGLGAATLAGTVGLLLGLLSGYFKAADFVLGRVLDGVMAIPAILLAISLIALTKPDIRSVIVVIAIPEVPRVARLVRSLVMALRHEAFIEAAMVSGCRPMALLWRHVVPNVAAPLLVQLSFVASMAVMIESTLSFLGVGIPPEQASWGGIVADGRGVYASAPWVMGFPGLFLAMMVLSVNMLGDGIRDMLDPRARSAASRATP